MRRYVYIVATLLAVALVCTSETVPSYPYRYEYAPVYMERSELEKSVGYVSGARRMENPGKIYIHGDRIYVNEKYRGIHVIDNSDPYTPEQIGFIIAPGCLDMAVKGNIMYLDNAVDFVAFDLESGEVTERIRDFFPEHLISPDGYLRDDPNARPEGMILVGWRKENV